MTEGPCGTLFLLLVLKKIASSHARMSGIQHYSTANQFCMLPVSIVCHTALLGLAQFWGLMQPAIQQYSTRPCYRLSLSQHHSVGVKKPLRQRSRVLVEYVRHFSGTGCESHLEPRKKPCFHRRKERVMPGWSSRTIPRLTHGCIISPQNLYLKP